MRATVCGQVSRIYGSSPHTTRRNSTRQRITSRPEYMIRPGGSNQVGGTRRTKKEGEKKIIANVNEIASDRPMGCSSRRRVDPGGAPCLPPGASRFLPTPGCWNLVIVIFHGQMAKSSGYKNDGRHGGGVVENPEVKKHCIRYRRLLLLPALFFGPHYYPPPSRFISSVVEFFLLNCFTHSSTEKEIETGERRSPSFTLRTQGAEQHFLFQDWTFSIQQDRRCLLPLYKVY